MGCPAAIRNWPFTRSNPVTISVTGCSTWMRVFISIKKNLSLSLVENEFYRSRVDISDMPASFIAASPIFLRIVPDKAGEGLSSTNF